jgi:hypothetical protein
MKIINKYANLIPYLYFIAITIYWFTDINRSDGITAYPILLLAIPFLWQILKPNKRLNFTLGITFVCLSSYLILAYLSDVFNIPSLVLAKGVIIYGGIFAFINFFMSVWIIRNSMKQTF